MTNRPYLSLPQRHRYLIDRGYIEESTLSEGQASFLSRTNFHYFLGYARNFRKLRRERLVSGDDGLDRLIGLVQLDRDLSVLVFAAVRDLEWRLRASLVDEHCAIYPSVACFFDDGHFRTMSREARPLHEVLREQILRSREPFVLSTFETFEIGSRGVWSGSPELMPEAERNGAIRQLPIWSVVDGWTLGVLERVITETAPTAADDWLWKRVASNFGVSNQIFQSQLASLIVLRNLVAHHSRLWMRPSAAIPKLPKIYRQAGRDSQAKSMHVVILTLASFLRKDGLDRKFIADVDALLSTDALYAMGIRQPLAAAT